MIEPGQVWQDCDKRMGERYMCVFRVDEEYAYCRQVVKLDGKFVPHRRMAITRLLLRRMKPGSTGWRLVDG